MDRIDQYRIAVCLAQCRSFTATAERLSLSKAVVSSAVRNLEEQLGTRLFHRTTRSVQLTQDGSALVERCSSLLSDLDELDSAFRQNVTSLSGRLRVDMPTGVARNLVLPRLPEFLRAHPGVNIELSCTDRFVDVVAEGFDCVLRVGNLKDSSLVARLLGHFAVLNVASPDYLARFGTPHTLADLDAHLLVHYVGQFGVSFADGFEYFDGSRFQIRAMRGQIMVNNTDAYSAACVAGLGITQMPVVGARPLIKAGKLIEILPDLCSEAMPVHLVYASRKHLSKRLRVLMDWLAEVLGPWVD